ncbi:AAA-domain-containing protein [Wolfiporia cocos MD-104 SS10]|uniref:AAA-domain-containing protein n=1 Tax=Wolfiporia cocos (strain MD-104) TaxID=742152 RepID=A0A2H3JJK9_WOLCO|nr:AAA-domain-containing protein [Wolfiporia cocos MD-104 SS10]
MHEPEALEDWPPRKTQDGPPYHFPPVRESPEAHHLRIRIPPAMPPNTRASTRQRAMSNASGSEYHESNASMDVDEDAPHSEEDRPEEPKVEYTSTSRGRKIMRKSYKESASEDDPLADDPLADDPPSPQTRHEVDRDNEPDDEEEELGNSRYKLRRRGGNNGRGQYIVSDDEGGATVGGGYATRSRSKNAGSASGRGSVGSAAGGGSRRLTRSRPKPAGGRTTRMSTRRTRQNGTATHDDEGYVDEPSSGSVDADESLDDAVRTSSEPEPELDDDADGEADAEGELEHEPEQDGRPYSLRQRAKINYAIPPPLEEMRPPPKPRLNGRSSARNTGFGRSKAPGWSATGAELSRWMGVAGDDSDSDYPTRTPRKGFGASGMGGMFAGGAGGAGGGGNMYAGDLAAAAGTPSNLGKVGDATLADADPLGVNQNVTFDEVGGLDDHINSLKEMTVLPLLYPEVFQRFDLTPPRGVLFHGPPGTGKTLLARALAASCRSDGRSISFFMRKGADCLSKWVGEAERQLRLLFEEARNQQPSIIFFDEIDGLAPVRSSKQDQIHASIVSTLLALMDGMDGRGQVIVIGATNRPDAIDPALRRPGRFDREFFFPLPNLEARERILRIMTRKWAGWEAEKGEENVKGLAKLTKGYGGADLRALCTEAALNAVQRRYPQIYKSSERLLLKPEAIEVELRDFMIAIKKLVPSSARSVSSAANPLPSQLVPLLQAPLDRIKDVIGRVMPISKARTALEEAEYEDDGGDNALERELMLQAMENLRVYRPRVVLHGPLGMGQGYVAAAALHHLEGYHVQSLDLGNLMSDSTRTPEAAIVQLFVEAKRHQPSVVYIPSLLGWCAAVSETSRTTVRAMLDTLSPTDPVLLLAVVDGPFSSLPRDVRTWFGPTRDNRVELTFPTVPQREGFFEGLLKDVRRPPNHFPDGVKRRKRVLEELPKAPPLEPRQPTAAELALQEEHDQRVITILKFRLGPILQELKRKFKRFTKRAIEEYRFEDFNNVPHIEVVTTSVEVATNPNGVVEVTEEERTEQVVDQPQANGVNGVHEPAVAALPAPPPQPMPQLFDMDLERINLELYRDRYLSPEDFLNDIRKIVHNADVRMQEDPERLYRAQAMLTAAEVSINEFDPQFRLDCQRMALRERKRREEYRRNKEKEKAAEENTATQEQVLRRSTRHNGQPLEISITDPLKLERKLKRQRSTSAAATPSEDENGERTQKRARAVADEDGTEDPVDVVGQPMSPGRLAAVRFADEVGRLQEASTSRQANEIDVAPIAPVSPHKADGSIQALLNSSVSTALEPQVHDNPSDVMVSTPLSGVPPIAMVDPGNPEPNPFLVLDASPVPEKQAGPSILQSPSCPTDLEDTPLAAPEVQTEQFASNDVPMETEREPTPLPEFIVNETMLENLYYTLRDSTGSLNVEQLEQLRATCLGCVWRHRSDWDRTALMQELTQVVQEFVEEVSLDDMDGSTP